LVIDDDPMLLELIRMQLEREGFAVVTAASGYEGVQCVREDRPDVILLDIMMPELDGWNTYEQLREIVDTPIIILTAKASTEDRARGLSIGSDDYLTKPYELRELTERIHRVLDRNVGGNGRHVVFDDGTLRIDLRSHTVTHQGEQIELSPTELRLLMYLASRPGKSVPCQELLIKVWGQEYADQERFLHAFIDHLRQKVEPDPRQPHYIHNQQDGGYCFSEECPAIGH
jgi:DNA-binding response OmpR family regulator